MNAHRLSTRETVKTNLWIVHVENKFAHVSAVRVDRRTSLCNVHQCNAAMVRFALYKTIGQHNQRSRRILQHVVVHGRKTGRIRLALLKTQLQARLEAGQKQLRRFHIIKRGPARGVQRGR